MRRRALLVAPLLLASCGLSERPYAERRQWPLLVRRPPADRRRAASRQVLLVRGVQAGPGMDQRGLQSLQADGSIRTDFYEEWGAPPALAAEEALRRWLTDSALFSAVIASASRLEPDLVLEGELTGLWSVPALGQAHAALGVTVVAQRGAIPRVLLQQTISAETPLAGTSTREAVEAQVAALAMVFNRIEALLRR